MANAKLVAVFLMCIVVIGALHVREAEAAADDKFKMCFTTCHDECKSAGGGFSFCEMKCDNECTEKETIDKLSQMVHA